jgi:hypothetical protein
MPKLEALPAAHPDRDELLRRCHGFRVRSEHGHLGFVEEVHLDTAQRRPAALAVRAGRIIVLLVPVEEVEDVVLDEGLVVLGPYESKFVPELRRDCIVLKTAV